MDKYLFQFCQKIVLFSQDFSKVLLAKRYGENDYDGVYSFIGGKMETTDKNLIEGMRREKAEEIGTKCKIKIYTEYATFNYFTKKDGNKMILPHYFAKFIAGEIKLNDEYSDYQWVDMKDLRSFEPKIENIYDIAQKLLKIVPMIDEKLLVEI